ncbi:MAG: YihY/virulence factor BrkB family protein [wastewater metagenome]|nr:YihY/virulence factor BrkB family protein [Candidatus Loosdrechtia aerotolerans]
MRLTKLNTTIEFIKTVFSEFSEDKALRLAAAMAYYTVFSLAPLLVIAIAIIGFVFGKEAAQGKIIEQFRDLVGESGARVVQTMIVNAAQQKSGIIAAIAGTAALLFGAGGFFVQLQDALNTIWEVVPRPSRGIMNRVRERSLSLTLVLGTGFLLLVSLILTAGLKAFGGLLTGLFPGTAYILPIANFAISFGMITLLFVMIFKILPDVKIAWSDVWIGAVVTALLFTIGKYFIGIYLGQSSTASVYGAAGSLVIILLWLYYSSIILLLGAEFTQVYANKYGSHVTPARYAMFITEHMREQQGMPHTEDVRRKEAGKRKEVTALFYKREHTTPLATKTEKTPGKSDTSWYTLSFITFIAGMIIGNRNR